jgi:diguanylate cyclase (GGDEF)-like protein
LNSKGEICRANHAAITMLDLAKEQIGALRLGAFIADISLPVFDRFLTRTLTGADGTISERCEVALRPSERRPGGALILEGRTEAGGTGCNVAMIDITANRAAEQRMSERGRELERLNQSLAQSNANLIQARQSMERMAMHDHLTGLANRHKFIETFAIEVERRNRTGSLLSLLMIDVDHFKAINDRLGHLAGDTCLRAMAKVMERSVRAADLAGRFGGEEFVVLLPDCDSEGAVAAANKLCQEIGSTPFTIGAEILHLTVSIGTATLRLDEPGDFDHLLLRADRAVYRAKQAGRNSVMVGRDDE